jgi:hypothetical protein
MLSMTAAVLAVTSLASSANAGVIGGKAWTVNCKDGTSSSSKTSLGMAICGCVNHLGSVEYPHFNCAGLSTGGPVKTGGAIKTK